MLRGLSHLLLLALLLASSVAASQTLNLAHERVLIITHAAAEGGEGGQGSADLVEKLLLHFTPHTATIDAPKYEAGMINRHTKVLVIAEAFDLPLPEPLLADLLSTERPIIWIGYAPGQLTARTDKFGFKDLDYNETQNEPPRLVYQGRTYSTNLPGYARVYVTDPATRIFSVLLRGGEIVPHVLHGGNLWFVNSMPDLTWTRKPTIAPTLVFADILHEVFETGVPRRPRALLRLEDVSTHVPPGRLESLVAFFESQNIPFAIGLIPNQRLANGTVDPLAEKIRLVRALRHAQNQARATIVLHGFFHTFGTGEDYEFWDDVKDAPLAGETRELYACKLSRGIKILRDLGLEPRYWETPHYSASAFGYRMFAEFFSHAIENRREESWTPYPFGPDRYGQIVIPENIDYIAPFLGRTVEHQLERARLLLIVRNAWAVGFAHPAVVPVREVERLVIGLRALGYEFVDASEIPTTVKSDYRPSATRVFLTEAILASRVNLPKVVRWLRSATQATMSAVSTASSWAGIQASAEQAADPCDEILAHRPDPKGVPANAP